MSFEMKPGRHYIAIWSGDGENGNLLCAVWRDCIKDKWSGQFRVRTYCDRKVFDSADRKDWHSRSWPASMTEDQVEANVDRLMSRIQANLADNSYALKVVKLDLHTDDLQTILDRMRTCPFFHIQRVKDPTQEEMDDADGGFHL